MPVYSVNSIENLQPRQTLRIVSDLQRLPAFRLEELAKRYGMIVSDNTQAQTDVLVVADGADLVSTLRAARAPESKHIVYESRFIDHLRDLRDRTQAREPTVDALPRHLSMGKRVYAIGRMREKKTALATRLHDLGLELEIKEVADAAVLLVADTIAGDRGNRTRMTAEDIGLPILQEREFYDAWGPVLEANRDWRWLNITQSRCIMSQWHPPSTGFCL